MNPRFDRDAFGLVRLYNIPRSLGGPGGYETILDRIAPKRKRPGDPRLNTRVKPPSPKLNLGKVYQTDMLEAEAKYRKDHQLDDHDILNNNVRSHLYSQLCKGYKKNARAKANL